LGDFIGQFVCYDTKRNIYKTNDSFLRIRVTLDTTKPLKRTKKISHPGKTPIICQFRYEKLPVFYFICGRMSHVDRLYSIRFQNPEVKPEGLWDDSIRVIPCKKTLGGREMAD
ncbi:hypothetical protein LINGRAHAP2_LOCUS11830, partial [Linum grandiflorum]